MSGTDVMIGTDVMGEIDAMNVTGESDVMNGNEESEIDATKGTGVMNETGTVVSVEIEMEIEVQATEDHHGKGVVTVAEDAASRRPAKVTGKEKEKEEKETQRRGRNQDEGDKTMGVRAVNHDDWRAGLATAASTETW